MLKALSVLVVRYFEFRGYKRSQPGTYEDFGKAQSHPISLDNILYGLQGKSQLVHKLSPFRPEN